jgi:hypothetical protein
MSYDELHLAIAAAAPQFKEAALRLLLELVALSIEQGTNELVVSSRTLASRTGLSREGVMRATRDLSAVMAADVNQGKELRFTLPAEWFSPQRSLFVAGNVRPQLIHWPTIQASTGQPSRPVLANEPGQHWPTIQANWPTIQASTGQPSRPIGQPSRPVLANHPGQFGADTYRNARARIDRSIDQDSTPSGLVVLIDRALRTVEILPAQQQDADILRDALCEYRTAFDVDSLYPGGPDQVAIARILAIAPIEELCGVLRKLLTARVPPGKQDMWFFTVLMQKIHGAPPKLVADRYDGMKRKKPPMNETLQNFGPELLSATAAGMKHF